MPKKASSEACLPAEQAHSAAQADHSPHPPCNSCTLKSKIGLKKVYANAKEAHCEFVTRDQIEFSCYFMITAYVSGPRVVMASSRSQLGWHQISPNKPLCLELQRAAGTVWKSEPVWYLCQATHHRNVTSGTIPRVLFALRSSMSPISGEGVGFAGKPIAWACILPAQLYHAA